MHVTGGDQDPPPWPDLRGLELSRVRQVVATPGVLLLLIELAPAREAEGTSDVARPPAVVRLDDVRRLEWSGQRGPGASSGADRIRALSITEDRYSLETGMGRLGVTAAELSVFVPGPGGRGRLVSARHLTPGARTGGPELLAPAHLSPWARRRAIDDALAPLTTEPAEHLRFWTGAVHAALETERAGPLPPSSTSPPPLPSTSAGDSVPYAELDMFRDVHLEESFVHTVVATPGAVTFLLDAEVLPRSPYWRAPPPGESSTWLPAALRFVGVTELTWLDGHQPPARDANGTKDYGSIDSLVRSGSTYDLSMGVGAVRIVASSVDLDVDADPGSQRASGGLRPVL